MTKVVLISTTAPSIGFASVLQLLGVLHEFNLKSLNVLISYLYIRLCIFYGRVEGHYGEGWSRHQTEADRVDTEHVDQYVEEGGGPGGGEGGGI